MKPSRRKQTQRAFTGLAGSPLAQIEVSLVVVPSNSMTSEQAFQDLEDDRKKRKAEQMRNLRKKRRDQLNQIRLALRVPVAQIQQQERERREQTKLAEFIAQATTQPKPRSVKAQSLPMTDYTQADINRAQIELLSPPSSSDVWPENDRRRVRPESTESDDGEPRSFRVKTHTDIEVGQALLDIEKWAFIEVDGTDVCRFCHATGDSRRRHIEKNHGDESEPNHDDRFGNVVAREVKRLRKRRRAVTAQSTVNRTVTEERAVGA